MHAKLGGCWERALIAFLLIGAGPAGGQTESEPDPEAGGAKMREVLAALRSQFHEEEVGGALDKVVVEASSSVGSVAGKVVSMELGSAVTTGDLNHDGFDDLVVSAASGSGTKDLGDGLVYDFPGSAAGLPSAPAAVLSLPYPRSHLGCDLAVVGGGRNGAAGLAVGARALPDQGVRMGFAFFYT